RRSSKVQFRVMSATELDFPDAAFQLATAVTVIQHLPYGDQERAVRELSRVVRGYALTIDRDGTPGAFSASHETYPRPGAEWMELWRSVGAELVEWRGQEFSYP